MMMLFFGNNMCTLTFVIVVDVYFDCVVVRRCHDDADVVVDHDGVIACSVAVDHDVGVAYAVVVVGV